MQKTAPYCRRAPATMLAATPVSLPAFPAPTTPGAPDSDGEAVWQALPALVVAPGVLLVGLLALLIALLIQRRAHRRAREKAERLSRLLQSSRAGCWEWNVQTGESRYDARWAEIVGYRLDELEPVSIDTWKRLAHPDDLVECNRRLQRHFFGRAPFYEMEIRLRHRAGHWIWVRDSGQVMTRTPEGEPEWMCGTHLDVTEQRRAQEEREGWLERFEELSRNVPGVIYQFRLRPDGSAHFPFASKGLHEIFGCAPEAVVVDGRPALDRLHPGDADEVWRSIERSAADLSTWHKVYRVNHPELGLRWVEGNATPSQQPDGSVTWHGHIRDITDLQRALERVRTAASVFETSHEGIVISDADYAFRDVNRAFERLTGYTGREIRGHRADALLPERDREEKAPWIRAGLERDGCWHGEVFLRKKSGETFPAELSISSVRDDHGRLSHYVTLMSDITLRKAQEHRLGKIANHDPLTGVGNRRMADERLRHAIAMARHSGVNFAICMMDLDEFKPINDRYGHDAGDHVLKTVAQRLMDLVRSEDCVCRLGGDEFLIILREPQGESVFERILEAIRIPIRIEAGIVRVSSSLGIALCAAECEADPEELLRRADRAVYAAKSAGRNRFRFDSD